MYTGASLASPWSPGLKEVRHRQFAVALLASLALHALFLLWLSHFRDVQRVRAPEPPLNARLAKPKPPDPPPPKVEPVVAAPVAPKPAPVAKARPQPAAPVRAPTVAPPPPLLSVEPQKQVEPAFVVPATPASPMATTDSQPGPGTPASPVTGPDPGSIARFRMEFMDIASRYKRYPRIAQDNNWQGRVELRIAFSETGTISSISVRKGTGRAVLDEEAQAMIRRAQAQVTIPPALRGKAFTLEIPVDFFLKE